MNRKPDIIRTVAIIFVVGLVVTGFTSMNTTESELPSRTSAYLSEASSAADTRRE